ncbi:phytase [Shewanella sp. Choline-02u-19]|uniref:phytase n=1 Tax=unclassified Shewanella TaxID=196818 RepID=UPI000C325F96|nr:MULTISPECIES: phytase [unclassified Shewanella]PKG56854.1 phytase [Shewanella sp. GutDb-MelDb]PKH56068.1 phytase [Shewanella sp. Bg11-22]PKI30656.1 phytase [Shewanella sp. Choline-02u-19]
MINTKNIITTVAATLFSCQLGTAMANPVAQQVRTALQGPIAASEMAMWDQRALFASERLGLVIEDKQLLKVIVPGQFEYLAVHKDIALTYDTEIDQVQGINLSLSNTQRLSLLPKRSFQVEWLCLQPRQADKNLYAWLGDDAGHAEQWLLSSDGQWQPQLVRSLSVSMGALKCAVDDNEQLYVLDNHQGLWRYPAAPYVAAESALAISMPDNDLSGLVINAGQIMMMDESGHIFDAKGDKVAAPFKGLQTLESLYVTDKQLWAYSDDDAQFYQAPWQPPTKVVLASNELIKEIPTAVESDISDRAGDTMDDPAIWIHPTTPEKSRVLGTNKRWGLLSFSMQGEQQQAIGAGRVNNIDIRQRVLLGGEYRDIAVASNRDRNSLSIFNVDEYGVLTQLPEQATTLSDIYGLCLYQPSEDELYVFANEKSGLVSQIELKWQDNHLKATQVRQFSVPSQPEGCVADDANKQLFLGEENAGIWAFNLDDKSANLSGKMIIKVGGPLVADIEGISLYQADSETGYLVVSSQGNDSYLLYNSTAPYAYVDRFRIGINASKGYDGSAETDGLDVTSSAVGSGVWSQGMMVVQDGRNRMPDQNQNFKWVPWSEISQTLQLGAKD